MLTVTKLNIVAFLSGALFTSPLNRNEDMPPEPLETGLASWYGQEFAGKPTANGEIFDPSKASAAHRTIKLGTWVIVKNLQNGSTVRVRVNDRGPYIEGRVIDLSESAARSLGYRGKGITSVSIYSDDGSFIP